MLTQLRFSELLGHVLQPPARTMRLDAAQHLVAKAYHQAHPGSGKAQQHVDQHFKADRAQQLIHEWRRHHPHPTDHCRQVDEQQRLITEYQQTFREHFGADIQQLSELGLGQVVQQLFGICQWVGKPLKQQFERVPE